jgi:hypothetical protein
MAVIDDLRLYVFQELPNRLVLLQNNEAIGNPNTENTTSKVLNAPLGTMYLQSDVGEPRPLYTRVAWGTDEDWKLINIGENTFTPTSTDSLENKTIDSAKNVISNLNVNNFDSNSVSTAISGTNASNEKLATEKAVSDMVNSISIIDDNIVSSDKTWSSNNIKKQMIKYSLILG